MTSGGSSSETTSLIVTTSSSLSSTFSVPDESVYRLPRVRSIRPWIRAPSRFSASTPTASAAVPMRSRRNAPRAGLNRSPATSR